MENFKNFLLEFKSETLDENFIVDMQFNPNEPLYVQKMKEMSLLGRTWININCDHLKQYNNRLCQHLIIYPKEVIPAMDSAIDVLFKSLYRNTTGSIQTRPYNCAESRNLRNLDPQDLDQLVTVSGLVNRQSPIIFEPIRCHFQCSVCHQVTMVPCERGRIMEPEFCTNCHAVHTQTIIHNLGEFIDKQKLKLQEAQDDMPPGETPHTVTLYCYQDLVDTVQPGDRVTVTGIYRSVSQRENPRQRIIKSVFNTKCANRLRDETDKAPLTEQRIETIVKLSQKPDLYDRLSSAIAPSIFGNETVKKGLLLMLFGGRERDKKTRANIHVLLCGDPGTSKSQLLQYVYKLTPRSQYTSGKGSSEVGLTAFVARDNETGHAAVQGGALALADNGVCCIDEFDKMSETTRAVLHEVMEQQTISLAKAGIICQLNARTSVLAAANPVSSCWDSRKTIIENIKLPPTLLSRFDLIFLILDPQDELYDARLAKHIISLFRAQSVAEDEDDVDGGVVDYELLRDYIFYARENVHPVLTREAQQYLVQEYVAMRRAGQSAKGQVSAYPRQLESLVRLAEAHARMRLSNEASVADCEEARRLQREALKQAAIDPLTGLIDIDILTTGITGGIRRRKEELARAIFALLEERRVVTFTYQRVLEEVRAQSDTMVTRENFEDALNLLKMENKIDWSGKTIRKR